MHIFMSAKFILVKQIYSELGLTETTVAHLQLCELKELWMKSSHVKKNKVCM